MSPRLQLAFVLLLMLQCALIVLHDLVDIPGWHHGRQVRTAVGPRKFSLGSLINAVFPGLAFYLTLCFWHEQAPGYVSTYWLAYCAITVGFAIAMWWVPYFFGTDAATRRLYAPMYAGTRHLLPARGDNPRPNALHLAFHALFVLNLGLALRLRFG